MSRRDSEREASMLNSAGSCKDGAIVDPFVRDILAAADVWEMTLPWVWSPKYWDLNVLARYRQAGFTFVSLTLQDWPPTFGGMRERIQKFKDLANAEADWLTFGSSLSDIDRGRREGKLVVALNSQETRPIEEDLSRVQALHTLGVRHMLLAYNVRNLVADGCAEVADAGLSNFGRRLVREMNRVGIVVDCSHTGRRSSLEAMELSERPPIFSHSNAYSVCPHIRNIRDEQIRACADRKGVIGIVGIGGFLGDAMARTETMFHHIDYIANLVGPEHVGLGTDYVDIYPKKDHSAIWQSINSTEKSWPDPADAWPNPTGTQLPRGESRCFAPEQLSCLIELMLCRGYSVEAVKGILGGNFRRVYAMAQ